MSHAKKFIEQMKNDREKNNPDLYENIVIRVDQKYAAMITVLGLILKFPASTAFTDILTKHLFDMAVTMDEERYKKIIDHLVKNVDGIDHSMWAASNNSAKDTIDSLIDKDRSRRFFKN